MPLIEAVCDLQLLGVQRVTCWSRASPLISQRSLLVHSIRWMIPTKGQ
jgi:hypothetical protein